MKATININNINPLVPLRTSEGEVVHGICVTQDLLDSGFFVNYHPNITSNDRVSIVIYMGEDKQEYIYPEEWVIFQQGDTVRHMYVNEVKQTYTEAGKYKSSKKYKNEETRFKKHRQEASDSIIWDYIVLDTALEVVASGIVGIADATSTSSYIPLFPAFGGFDLGIIFEGLINAMTMVGHVLWYIVKGVGRVLEVLFEAVIELIN